MTDKMEKITTQFSDNKNLSITKRRIPIILLVVILSLIIPQSYTLSTVPLEFDPFPHLESGSYISTTYTFQKAKRTKPTLENTFVGVNSMDYNLNKPYYGDFYLYFSLGRSVVDTTKMNIYFYYMTGAIKALKLSLLIISPDFFYTDIYSSDYMYFSLYNTMQTITLTNTTYSAAIFMTYCDLETFGTSNGIMGISLETVSSNYPSIDMEITFEGDIYYGYIDYKVLVFYPILAKEKYNIDIIVSYYMHLTTPYTFDIGFNTFKLDFSIFFMALKAFNYEAMNSPTNDGFKYSHTFSSDSTYQLIASTTLDDQFNKLTQVYVILHKITCPSTHPVRGINRTSLLYECFDECYENEYVEYVATEFYHQCVECGDVLCKSCESATKCSSCIYGYDLVEVSQSCALNPGFYDDGTGGVFLCSNVIVGCKYCTSTGGTCNVCEGGYFLSSGTCERCDTIASYCTNCTSTQCLSCASPKVLINATLCSNPVPNSTPPKPHIPCTDALCFECSPTNPSQCLSCHSDLYKVISGQCQPICGDGIIIPIIEICDDSNTIDNDGCSSNCMLIEKDFDCISKQHSIKTTMFTSICHYTKIIEISLEKIYKHPKENTLNILLKNHLPSLQYVWKEVESNNELIKAFDVKLATNVENSYWFEYSVRFVENGNDKQFINNMINGVDSVMYRSNYEQYNKGQRLLFDENNYIIGSNDYDKRLLLSNEEQQENEYSYILLQLSYEPTTKHFNEPFIAEQQQSLNHELLTIQFNPTLTQRPVFTPVNLPYEITFPLVTENNHLIQYYSEEYYSYAEMLFYIGVLISVCAVVMLIMSVVGYFVESRNSRAVLVTVETVAIGQLAYFTMLQIGELNPFFIHLLDGLKYINLYDILLSQEQQQSEIDIREAKGLNIESLNLSNNVNITLILILVLMLIGGIMMLIDRLRGGGSNDNKNNSNNKNNYNSTGDNNQEGEGQNNSIIDENNDVNKLIDSNKNNNKDNAINNNNEKVDETLIVVLKSEEQQHSVHDDNNNKNKNYLEKSYKDNDENQEHKKDRENKEVEQVQIENLNEKQQSEINVIKEISSDKKENDNDNVKEDEEPQEIGQDENNINPTNINNNTNSNPSNELNNNTDEITPSFNNNNPNTVITENPEQQSIIKQELSLNKIEQETPSEPMITSLSKLYKTATFFIFNLSLFLFMFLLYKLLFFACIQLFYRLNNLTTIDIVILSIIIIIFLFFVITSCLNKFSPWYKKVLEKLSDNKNSPYDVRDILGKHKVIPKHKLIKIQERFDRFIELLPENEKPPRVKEFYSNKEKNNKMFCCCNNNNSTKINVRSWYVGIFFIEHVINIIAVVIISPASLVTKQYFNIVPILIYITIFTFYSLNNPYKHPNMYRLYITYFIGITIQSLLLSRSVITNPLTSIEAVGREEPSIGVYVPFTIAILLLVLGMIGLCYVFYSIKRFRCCELEVEWERVEIGQLVRVKLMELVKEECGGEGNGCEDEESESEENNKLRKVNTRNRNANNTNNKSNEHENEEEENQSHLQLLTPHNDKNIHNNNTNTNWESSELEEYNSTSSTPFFHIPLNLRKHIFGVHKMVSDKQSNNKHQQEEEELEKDYTKREINREITSKLLKKEIKEKLLNSKIERKIMLREGVAGREGNNDGGGSEEVWNVKNVLNNNNNKKRGSNGNNKLMIGNNKNISTWINTTTLSSNKNNEKSIQQHNQQQQPNHLVIHDDNGEHVDYLYTDTKTYNVYEEFDMI